MKYPRPYSVRDCSARNKTAIAVLMDILIEVRIPGMEAGT